MSQKLEQLKERFLYEHRWDNRKFLDKDEEKAIKDMDKQSRKEYIRVNEIYQDTEPMSQTSNKYYRIQPWDITNEEFSLIVQIESARKISKIYYILNFFLVIFIISAVLTLLFNFIY